MAVTKLGNSLLDIAPAHEREPTSAAQLFLPGWYPAIEVLSVGGDGGGDGNEDSEGGGEKTGGCGGAGTTTPCTGLKPAGLLRTVFHATESRSVGSRTPK